jgi:thiol-disulfide isomerase/thioredoxin
MEVTKISSMADFNSLLETSKSKLVVVDFSATWCGPCRFIHPIYEKMAAENPDVAFAEVDVDEVEDVRCILRFVRRWTVVHVGAVPSGCWGPTTVSFAPRLTILSFKCRPAGRSPLRDPGDAHLPLLQERGEDRRNDGSRPEQAAAARYPAQVV